MEFSYAFEDMEEVKYYFPTKTKSFEVCGCGDPSFCVVRPQFWKYGGWFMMQFLETLGQKTLGSYSIKCLE